jgi:N-acetylmuramoyl-L-alanine amidase
MTIPPIIHRLSPNFGDRPAEAEINMLLIHYTGMQTAEASLARLCDPEAKVSAHYLIDEDGTLYGLVEEAKRAWHAGVGHWSGETDINSCSLGIELQNPGHEFGYRAFPDAQLEVLVALCSDILSRHPISSDRVLGHSDIAPRRKEDPGEMFDWQRLAMAGIGELPETPAELRGMTEREARKSLIEIGYDPDAPLAQVLTAFQRHYRQSVVNGLLDDETAGLIRALTR